jgi:hypothetical protein
MSITSRTSKKPAGSAAEEERNLWHISKNEKLIDRHKIPFLSLSNMPGRYSVKSFNKKMSNHYKAASIRFQKNNYNSSTPTTPRKKTLRSDKQPTVVTPDVPYVPTVTTTPIYARMRDLMLDENGCGGSTKRLCFIEDIFACQHGDNILLIITDKNPDLYENYRQYLNKGGLAYESFELCGSSPYLQIPATIKSNSHGLQILDSHGEYAHGGSFMTLYEALCTRANADICLCFYSSDFEAKVYATTSCIKTPSNSLHNVQFRLFLQGFTQMIRHTLTRLKSLPWIVSTGRKYRN